MSKVDKPAYTVEVLNRTGKAVAFLWLKARESAGASKNWNILNNMLRPKGMKMDGVGSSTKLAEVLTVLKISRRKLDKMGIKQELPTRPYSLKEAVKLLIELDVLDQEDADMVDGESHESSESVKREQADREYVREIKESSRNRVEIERKGNRSTLSIKDKTGQKKAECEALEENGKREHSVEREALVMDVKERTRRTNQKNHLKRRLVENLQEKMPGIAKKFIEKARQLDNSKNLESPYCWMCGTTGHPAKECPRLSSKIKGMCMACSRTDHVDGKCFLTEETCAKCGTYGHHQCIHMESEWPKKMLLIDHWGIDGFEDEIMADKKKFLKSSVFNYDETTENRSPILKRRK